MQAEDKTVKHVLVLVAMEAEASALIAHMSHLSVVTSIFPHAPHKIVSGPHNGYTVSIVTNGKDAQFGVDNVGTTPAAVTTFASIAQLQPDLIINAGTAGGYKSKGAAIGDVFIGSHIRHHDRRIPIPGFKEYAIGNHHGLTIPHAVEKYGFKVGGVTTSNSLDHSPTDDEIIKENDASVKDMEAAAIAWVAELSNLPFIAVKVVTDIVDGDRVTQDEFFENLGAASRSLQDATPKLIDFVLGKKLSEL